MDFVPHVVSAEYIKDFMVKVRFNDGTLKILDLKQYAERGNIFEPLKDVEFFRHFYIDLNTLCWPNGADIAPETLYQMEDASGVLTAA